MEDKSRFDQQNKIDQQKKIGKNTISRNRKYIMGGGRCLAGDSAETDQRQDPEQSSGTELENK